MNFAQLGKALTTTYVIIHWGIRKPNTPPSRQFAVAILRRRWVDTRLDGAVYHVNALLDTLAPNMSVDERINFVLACHTVLARDSSMAGLPLTQKNLPQELRPYLT